MFKEAFENPFEDLQKKFFTGVKWINAHWNRIDIKRHIKEFQEQVIEPMDKAWAAMPQSEKKVWLNQT